MADYNINAITRRVVFTGSAGLGPYAFTFEVLDENDVAVYFNTTLLTLTTDYTVAVNANGTGSVTIVTGTNVPSTPTASDTIIIVGARDIERVTDFVTAGDLLASSLNEQLDSLTIFDQQVAEENKRSLRAPVYDPALVEDGGTLDMTLPAKAARAGKYLQFNSTTGNPEAGPDSTDVTALADIATDIATLADIEDGTDATDAIQTAASISSNISTVAGISANVTTVAGISSDVTAVAADATDIGTVATNIASVNTVATNITDVIAVANDLNEAVSEVETVANDLNEAVSEIETVAASISNVDTVGTNIANVNTVAGNNANITTVAGISANVTTVAGISGNVTTVAGISSDVTTVAADGTDIGTVATNIANVNTVAGINSNVTTVAGISGNVTTVSGISSNVTTVAGVSSDVTTVAGQISPTNNVGTVAGIASDVSTVSGVSANVTTVAGNTTNINTVAGISGNVTTVAGISSDVTAVAADATDIGTVATNLAGTDTIGTVATNISNVNTVAGISSNVTTVAGISSDVTAVAADSTDIGTVATNIANVNTVGGSISNVNTVATNISSVNDFADKYRIGASDPTTNNDEGDLFYNTTSDTLKVYTGTAWEQGVTAGSGFLALTGGTMTGDINYGDSVKAVFGAGSDLQIYHNGTQSIIEDVGTGPLRIRSNSISIENELGTETISALTQDGAVTIYYDGSPKLATTATGADITGTLTADGLTVDGDAEVVTSTTATNMSDPMLRVSGSSYTAGGVYGMGFHYTDDATNVTPTFIGYKLNSGSGNTNGHLVFGTRELTTQGSAPLERMRIGHNGDVSLYADDGTTQGFYWDASTQYLGLGTTGPSAPLHINGTSSLSTEFKVGNSTWNSSTGSGILHQYRGSDGYSELQINSTSASGSNVLTIRDGSGVASALYNDGSAHFEGNVGIGTASPSSFFSGASQLVVGSGSGDQGVTIYSGTTNNSQIFFADGTSGADAYRGIVRYKHNDNAMAFYTNGANERMTITSDGNVVLNNASYLQFKDSGGTPRDVLAIDGFNGLNINSAGGGSAAPIVFKENGSEIARFDTSGNFLCGTTSTATFSVSDGAMVRQSGRFLATTSSDSAAALSRRGTDGSIVAFYKNTSLVGTVSVTGSGVTYNTTSDLRLKENIEPLVATDKLMAMNPVSYNWKADPDGPRSMGFIAQEMKEVMPEAVAVGNDEDAMMSMDYGRITPILVSALQDAHRKIEELAAEIAELKGAK